jgi:catechol 1,2-dioxygenase
MTDIATQMPLVERVIAAMSPAREGADPAFQARMAEILRAVHRVLDELQITDPELDATWRFFNELGSKHEFLMLFDQLAISMHVNDITYAGQGDVTQNNVEGPFYRAGSPMLENPGVLAADDEPGDVLFVRGRAFDARTGGSISGATIEIWQTNQQGMYESIDPTQRDYNLRGTIVTDVDGAYEFRTIVPSGYPMGIGTTVERLLRKMGRDNMRPAHIHYLVKAPGYVPLTTLQYFEGDPLLPTDAIFSVKSPNLTRLTVHDDPTEIAARRLDRPFKSVTYDFALYPAAV